MRGKKRWKHERILRHVCCCILHECLFTFWGSPSGSDRAGGSPSCHKTTHPGWGGSCTVPFKQQHPGHAVLPPRNTEDGPTYPAEPRRDTFTHFLLQSPSFCPEPACLCESQRSVPGRRCPESDAQWTPRCSRRRPVDGVEMLREFRAVRDVLPNNNTAAMARLVPLLFVLKCHGRAETGHVTAKRGGRICPKYELNNHAHFPQTSQTSVKINTRMKRWFQLFTCCLRVKETLTHAQTLHERLMWSCAGGWTVMTILPTRGHYCDTDDVHTLYCCINLRCRQRFFIKIICFFSTAEHSNSSNLMHTKAYTSPYPLCPRKTNHSLLGSIWGLDDDCDRKRRAGSYHSTTCWTCSISKRHHKPRLPHNVPKKWLPVLCSSLMTNSVMLSGRKQSPAERKTEALRYKMTPFSTFWPSWTAPS